MNAGLQSLFPGAMEAPQYQLGKYRMIARLGRGGTADVYLAVSQGIAGFQKVRVLKVLRTELHEDKQLVEMFLSEARLAARLNHPNIVQTNEVGQMDGQLFMDMEYVEGQSLSAICKRAQQENSRVRPALVARMMADALAALHYAHEFTDFDGTPLHIVHRDVSPHNIIIQYDGTTKLVDFGVAKVATPSLVTETGIIKGKIPYMAPEQAVTPADVDRRVDIFAIGIVLFEQTTMRRFWAGKTDTEILHGLFQQHLPFEDFDAQGVPTGLEPILRRALAMDRDQRYATAAEMLADLERYIESTEPKANRTQVGEVLTRMFDTDRRELRARIDAQIKSLDAGAASTMLELGSADWTGPSSRGVLLAQLRDGSPTAANDQQTVTTTTRESAAKWPLLVLALAIVVAAGVLGFAILQGRRPQPEAPAAPAPKPAEMAAPTSSSSPPAPASVRIYLAAEPREARLFLDDMELPQNPHEASVTRDLQTHRLRAEARGYAERTIVLTFDRDVQHTIQLEKLPDTRPERSKARATRSAKAERAADDAQDDVREPARKPAARPLDESNPFE